jgi:hypothetical protein
MWPQMFLYNISPTQWARIGNIQPTINAFFVKRVIARQFFLPCFMNFPNGSKQIEQHTTCTHNT